MIRIKLRQVLDDRSFEQKRKITVKELAEGSGLSGATLARVLNQPGYNARLEVIDALCGFLQCQPGDLLEYVPEEK